MLHSGLIDDHEVTNSIRCDHIVFVGGGDCSLGTSVLY